MEITQTVAEKVLTTVDASAYGDPADRERVMAVQPSPQAIWAAEFRMNLRQTLEYERKRRLPEEQGGDDMLSDRFTLDEFMALTDAERWEAVFYALENVANDIDLLRSHHR